MAGVDFDYAKPEKAQTDPESLEVPRSGTYPRHVHRWNAATAPLNDWHEVRTLEEHQRALSEGWFDDIQVEGPEGAAESEPTPKRKR